MNRHGRVQLSTILLVALVAYSGLFIRDNWAVVWTKVQMDEITQVSLLDWRDKSERRAKDRINHELKEKGVPAGVLELSDVCGLGSCCFSELEEGYREVECSWEDYLWFPFSDRSIRLEYWVGKYLDPDDHLRDLEED